MTKMSATSSSPALFACMESPQPGIDHHDRRVGRRGDLDFHLSDAHRLDDHEWKARRAEDSYGVGHRQREAAEVARVAMERMKTCSSVA